MEITKFYSPNFDKKKRINKNILAIIIHYTGMQSERESLKKLISPKSKVSSHFFINRTGKIFRLVNEDCVAWHAGKSKWKKFINLNDNSIGVELVNKGHKFGYQNFSQKQIKSLISLCKNLKKKYSIKKENFLGHSDIAPLRKIDPGEKFPWKKLSTYSLGRWYKKSKGKFKINEKKIDIVFFQNLKKLGYRYFSIKKRNTNDKKIIRSFQQHYLPNNVTGKIDYKTLKISHFLTH